MFVIFTYISNVGLASCPWGPVTANGVDLLTEIYVIYIIMPNTMSIDPLAMLGGAVTHTWKES